MAEIANILRIGKSYIGGCDNNSTNRPMMSHLRLLSSPNSGSISPLKSLTRDTVEISATAKSNMEDLNEKLPEYISMNKGVGNNKSQKNIVSLIQKLKREEISVDKLSDGEILDIWSWRYYDGQLADFPELQKGILERFNSICKNNEIQVQPNEVLIRSIPETGLSPNSNEFSLGKPDSNLGNWPASLGRVEKAVIEDGEFLPEQAIARIVSDKINYLVKHPEYATGELPESTVYLTVPKQTTYNIKGFDWSKLGKIKETGFGSPAFKKEVDTSGLSTEVNVPNDLKFRKVKEDNIIPFTLPEDGGSFDIRIVYVEPV